MSLITFAVLAALALGLTITMFIAKQSLLGFPCGIFWAISGAYAYQHYTTVWDLWYLIFFAAMGMLIFTIFAAFALRKRDLAGPDADKGAFIDEEGRRHPPRQTIEVPRRQGSWGDIDRLPMDATEDRDYESPYSEAVHNGITTEAEARKERAKKRKAKIARGEFR